MTQAARLVLEDAKYALKQHHKTSQANAFRVSWFAVVALLRAVGHVLGKVDGGSDSSPAMRRAVNEKWTELVSRTSHDNIYWEFIVPMRNDFLKQYKTGVKRTLGGVFDVGSGRGGFGLEGGAGMGPTSSFVSCIVEGTYAGKPEADVAREAIEWWGRYLDSVDVLASKYAAITPLGDT